MIHVKQGNRSREEEKAGGRKKARRAEVRFESFAISKIQTVKRQYLFTGCSMPHQRVWSLKSFLRVSSARRNLFSSLPLPPTFPHFTIFNVGFYLQTSEWNFRISSLLNYSIGHIIITNIVRNEKSSNRKLDRLTMRQFKCFERSVHFLFEFWIEEIELKWFFF